jgi:hypothetical protein
MTTDDVYAAILSLKEANELFASRVERVSTAWTREWHD